jgi:beta-glucosidase
MASDAPSPFPTDFVWGAATAAYQIEGAAAEDGRGESVWDRFCATPGKVRNDDSGAVACDFYHRYEQDIGLMRELGVDAFRFSIAWPRILPDGRGRVNTTGLDFYDRLVDELLASGIEPFVTLYHWDLPQALEDQGGWPARATAEAFVEFTELVARRLGDRVRRWVTHNEPWVVAWLGYGWGHHAPGRATTADAIAAAHHLLLSHGWAAEVLRREAPGSQVGITLNLGHVYPASDAVEDEAAVFQVDGFHNRWFLDPLFRGEYPSDMLEHLAPVAPPVLDGDLRAIAAPIDFLGVNNYSRQVVRASPNGSHPVFVHNPEAVYTDMDWEVYPDGLFDLLVRLRDDYAPPAIYVTENGAAFPDIRGHDGHVRDPERQAYIADHIAAVGRAVEAGSPVQGYFVWSLLDNFEWAHGYWKRFGIVYIDYPTLERVPKTSFSWYRDFVAGQRSAEPIHARGGAEDVAVDARA